MGIPAGIGHEGFGPSNRKHWRGAGRSTRSVVTPLTSRRQRRVASQGAVSPRRGALSSADTSPGRGVNRSDAMERVGLALWDALAVAAVMQIFRFAGTGVMSVARIAAVSVLAVAVIALADGYGRTAWLHSHPLRAGRKLLVASAIVSWAMVLISHHREGQVRVLAILGAWLIVTVAWFAGRRIAAVLRAARPERVLVIGTGDVSARIRLVAERRRSGMRLIGCLDDRPPQDLHGQPNYLGRLGLLPELLANDAIDRIVVAFTSKRDHDILRVLRDTVGYQCPVDIVPRFFDFLGPEPPQFYRADGLAFMSVPAQSLSWWQMALKRTFDISASVLLLAILSPLLVAIASAVGYDSGRPIFFRQQRAGRDGGPFTILKFRTLRPLNEAEESARAALELGEDAPDDIVNFFKGDAQRRVTRVGKFLRRTSLDELPQLWNILRGDMSLIGPRPLALPEFNLLTGWELRRQHMRPGLTGLWQVSGRSETTWQKRMAMDHAQVHHWSLWSDLEILADTIPAMLQQRGAL
jgi:exopolysaccharide biosynthesis polyprenyl glycosylphosphotransferase